MIFNLVIFNIPGPAKILTIFKLVIYNIQGQAENPYFFKISYI